jgi:dTDP-4-amino-4,6-dideoxygalactose transaminase
LLNFNEISTLTIPDYTEYNYSYYPIIFKEEKIVLAVIDALLQNEVIARRYFYPSLNTLPFIKEYQPCSISESISKRILAIPLFFDLNDRDVIRIAEIINQHL